MIKVIKTKVVVRSPGPQGPAGPSTVASSTPGPQGWSPVIAVVEDGERRVQQIVGWTGGAGAAPSTGLYIGPEGLVGDISQATDIRGEAGGGGGGGGGNSFTTIAVSGQSSIVADSTTDTLTVVAGTAATVTTNATTDTLTVGVALGTSGATACAGNDSRLSDQRTPLAHTHPTGDITGLGGAATLNVGTAGGTVAAGNDSRFTDARTPTVHASSHASGGGDPVTLAQSQVTNLVSDLAGKAASSHTHTASQVTDFSEAVDDRVAALLVAGTNVTLDYNDGANTLTVNASGGGGGGAPTTADYLVRTADAGLSAERVVTDSTTVTANWGTSGQVAFERAALTGEVTAPANSNATTIAAGAVTTTKMGGDVTAAGKALLDDADASTQRTTLGLGTSSTLNVAAAGNAAAGEVVKGNDTRLSDSRTPTAHAASHASAGGDPITIAQSQVTSLTSDLALKAPLASPSLTGTPSAPTAAADTNTTQLATCAFVLQEIGNDTTKAAASHTHTASQISDSTTAGRALLTGADASAQRTSLGLGTLATQSGTFSGTSSGTNTGDQNLFSTIAVSGQSNVVADAASDTLTLIAGTNVTITTNAATDEITIAASGGGGGSIATDTIWDASGDLAVGIGANTAARLAAPTQLSGSTLYYGPNGVEWVNSSTHYTYHYDFLSSSTLNSEWSNLNSGGTSTAVVSETGAIGINSSGTGTSASNYRHSYLGSANSFFLGFGRTIITWRVKIPTLSVTASERFDAYVGLYDHQSTIVDGAWFQYSDNVNSGKWECKVSDNSSQTTTDSGVTVTTNWTTLTIDANAGATEVKFYINGSLVHTESGANIPSSSRGSAVSIGITKTVGTTARSIYSDYVDIYVKY